MANEVGAAREARVGCIGAGFERGRLVPPRSAPLLERFRGNVREEALAELLDGLWQGLKRHLQDPVTVEETRAARVVTFMGAVRFVVEHERGRVGIRKLKRTGEGIRFAPDPSKTVIDLPCRLDGFWMDAFLLPWMEPIAHCLIDHYRCGPGPDWHVSIRQELQRALRRSFDWYRVRCRLRDALGLDPRIVGWCRKGRSRQRNYVTQVHYNEVLRHAGAYASVERDNPRLLWLCNFLDAPRLWNEAGEPVALIKAHLRQQGVTEAGWRRLANGKEQDFRHLVDFNGNEAVRRGNLASWLRFLQVLRYDKPIPRPLLELFQHTVYDGERIEERDYIVFRGVPMQAGVMRALLDEGARRLARGLLQRFIEEELPPVLVWLGGKRRTLEKNQFRQGWSYLRRRAAQWLANVDKRHELMQMYWESRIGETRIGPWLVVPLNDAWEVHCESLALRHCVDQYITECTENAYKVFSVRSASGKRAATLGLEWTRSGWRIADFRGFANRPVPQSMQGLAGEVLDRFLGRVKVKAPAVERFDVKLGRVVVVG